MGIIYRLVLPLYRLFLRLDNFLDMSKLELVRWICLSHLCRLIGSKWISGDWFTQGKREDDFLVRGDPGDGKLVIGILKTINLEKVIKLCLVLFFKKEQIYFFKIKIKILTCRTLKSGLALTKVVYFSPLEPKKSYVY